MSIKYHGTVSGSNQVQKTQSQMNAQEKYEYMTKLIQQAVDQLISHNEPIQLIRIGKFYLSTKEQARMKAAWEFHGVGILIEFMEGADVEMITAKNCAVLAGPPKARNNTFAGRTVKLPGVYTADKMSLKINGKVVAEVKDYNYSIDAIKAVEARDVYLQAYPGMMDFVKAKLATKPGDRL